MNNGKRANRPKGKPRGKPFTGKDDPRSNRGGNLNAAAQSYEIRFRNALASGLPPAEFAAIVVESVKRNRPGAREFYADRLLGKVTQPIEAEQNIVYRVIYEKPKDKVDANG